VQAKIDAELGKTILEMEHSMFDKEGDIVHHHQLPKTGMTQEQVMESLRK
jgi:sphinganine-1-phosphate aldolase